MSGVADETDGGQTPPPSTGSTGRLLAQLRAQVDALLAADAATRVGHDPEDLHDFRVATRRLRAYLRVAEPLLDETWSEPLRAELKWLAGVLGTVRDLDVLLERLHVQARTLEPAERTSVEPVLRALEEERSRARAGLLEALEGERYLRLVEQLDERPRLSGAHTPLRKLAEKAFARLERDVAALGSQPTDDELHRLRIRGKRARYAAELASGKRMRKVVERAKTLQDVLGEHQDAVGAEERLRTATGRGADLALGRLVERERTRRATARADWPDAWKRLRAAGARAWS
jgi:CHAD domain-containing protein